MASWQQFLSSTPGGSNFAMSGVYLNDRLYLGGYGSGDIYGYLPFTAEATNTGEAVLSMCVFKGVIYATSENNSTSGTTRVLRRGADGQWTAVNIPGYASYFMCVWGNYLLVMTTADLTSTDYWYSSDGVNFHHGWHFSDWLWVPTIFKNELYILGHSGPPSGPGSPKVVKWNGSTFVDVPALCGTAGVAEWQCAVEHGGYMFLGAGGWTIGGGTSLAAVYRFDGTNVTSVKSDLAYHECQALLSSTYNNYLYAAFGHGFKSDVGGSQLYASLDGTSAWADAGSFSNCPQIYVLLDSPYGFIAAGGYQGNTMAYFYSTEAVPVPEEPEVPPVLAPTAPTRVVVYPTNADRSEVRIYWIGSANASGYRVDVRMTNLVNGYGEVANAGYTTAPDVDFIFNPYVPGYLEARVKALGGFIDTGTSYPTWTTESEWSPWSSIISVLPPKIELAAPAAPIAVMPIVGTVNLTFAGSTQNTAATTQVFYKAGSDPIMYYTGIIVASTVSAYDVTNQYVRMVPGESYTFYLRYNIPNTQVYSPFSPASATITYPGSFAPPGSLTAGFISPESVQLNWADNSVGEANFVVARWRDGQWTDLLALPAGATSYIDTTQSLASLVRYRVMARGGMIHSEWSTTGLMPEIPGSFQCTLDNHDTAGGTATISFNMAGWLKYKNYPYVVMLELSTDGTNYVVNRTLYGDNIASPQTIALAITTKVYYIRFKAANGAGVVYSNILTIQTQPPIYTVANSPTYSPGLSQGRSVIYGSDGAGEAGYALTGFARHQGYPYAALATAIGLLDKEVQEAEIITQPVGREWYGEKTIYSAELEGTTNRDVIVSVNSRNDYKVPTFDPGKDVALRGRGRTGYVKAGHEFEVRFKWSSGVPHYFQAWDARIWLKMTGRQGLSTLPYFYGSKGYNPRGAK